MKKIILIDDNNKNQRAVYGASFVDEDFYADVLYHVEKLNSQSDLSFLNDAVCVMLHDSLEDYINGEFVFSSHKAKERIEDYIQETGVPYVLFSDGHSITAEWREETPNVVYSIKKSEFYLHLKDFISYFKKCGNIDMRIIAYGKDFLRDLICKWCQLIIHDLNGLTTNEYIDISCINKKALRQVIENSQPQIGISFDEIMCKIEDQEITVGQMRTNINSIISSVKKYGKNINSWE